MAKVNKVRKVQSEDNTIYKAAAALGLLMLFTLLLQLVDKNYVYADRFRTWRNGLKWTAIVSLALTAISVAAALLTKGNLRKAGFFSTGFFGVLALGAGDLYKFWIVHLDHMQFIVVAACALYLVWLLYSHDFFLIALQAALCGGAFYLHGSKNSTSTSTVVLYALLILLSLAVLFLACKAGKNGGLVSLGKLQFRLFSGKAGPMPLYLSCAIALACLAAALLFGSMFALYCVYAAAGGLFIAACYYTIRLN